MEGDLSQFSLVDLVQMLCAGMYDREVLVMRENTLVGTLVLEAGQIRQCQALGLYAEEALYALMGVREGRYLVRNSGAKLTASATLRHNLSWQNLLMEGARLLDEAIAPPRAANDEGGVVIPLRKRPSANHWIDLDLSSSSERTPSLPSSPEIEAAPTSSSRRQNPAPQEPTPPPSPSPSDDETFAQLLQASTNAYLRRDYDNAHRYLQQCLELRPNDKRVQQNLERLQHRRKHTK